jgi:hypothetical protein
MIFLMATLNFENGERGNSSDSVRGNEGCCIEEQEEVTTHPFLASSRLWGAQRRLTAMARWFWDGGEKRTEEKECWVSLTVLSRLC